MSAVVGSSGVRERLHPSGGAGARLLGPPIPGAAASSGPSGWVCSSSRCRPMLPRVVLPCAVRCVRVKTVTPSGALTCLHYSFTRWLEMAFQEGDQTGVRGSEDLRARGLAALTARVKVTVACGHSTPGPTGGRLDPVPTGWSATPRFAVILKQAIWCRGVQPRAPPAPLP